jgi:RNA polymerase sigma-70 factor (ECF subfamily)
VLDPGRGGGMSPSDRIWRERGLRGAVLAGDERAWQVLYEQSFAGLAAYVAWRCAGLRDLEEEIIQETWLTAVKRIRAFDPERGSFTQWLRGIAGNLLRNQFRRRQRRTATTSSLNGQTGLLSVEKTLEQRDLAEQVARALVELPPKYEAALRAKYLDQQSVADIARDWNETPKAIESLLTRARQAFREAFGPGPDDPKNTK